MSLQINPLSRGILPVSTWKIYTQQLMYPAPEPPTPDFVVYKRSGSAEVVSDRHIGQLLDVWA